MTIGERIRAIRKEKSMTQKQVADACGMADSAIRKYESGSQTPKLKTVRRIAAALGVHPGELMGLKDYGYSIWGPEGLTSDDIDNARLRAAIISENQKILNRIKETMAKKEHITMKLELLNDDGVDVAVQAIDTIVGNPRLSTYPSSPPYFQQKSPEMASQPPAAAPQSTLNSNEGTDTTPPPEGTEGPQEGE